MPRELRDMTYDHLLEPEYIVRVDPGESLRWCLPDLQCASKIIPAIDPVTESLFLPENVGQEFAFEMAQQLYQRGSFDVLDPRGLDMVFDNDLFSVHKKPCGYPRGLRIHMWENLQGGVWLKNMRNEQETLQEALVWRVLDKGLKTAQVIELVLHFCDVQMCKSLLKNIAPLVYGLRAEGTCVSVVRRVFLGHNLRTAAYGSPEYDMTWLFNQTMQGCLTTINEARVHVSDHDSQNGHAGHRADHIVGASRKENAPRGTARWFCSTTRRRSGAPLTVATSTLRRYAHFHRLRICLLQLLGNRNIAHGWKFSAECI